MGTAIWRKREERPTPYTPDLEVELEEVSLHGPVKSEETSDLFNTVLARSMSSVLGPT